jgi:hypothetical protein
MAGVIRGTADFALTGRAYILQGRGKHLHLVDGVSEQGMNRGKGKCRVTIRFLT